MQLLNKAAPALAALTLTALTLAPARAATDQSYTGPVGFGAPISFAIMIGQSFTPTLNSLNFVTLAIDQVTAGSTGRVDILAGAGTGGTVLGTSATTEITNYEFGASGGSPTTFTFAAPVSLTPGSVYTLRLDPNDYTFATVANIDDTSTNPYSGGQEYEGNPRPGYDLYFAEGTTAPAAVPEPSTIAPFACAGLGLLGLTLRARRKSKPA